jgi:thiosulfate/3-mercaptopyruvate sulfurtransferase
MSLRCRSVKYLLPILPVLLAMAAEAPLVEPKDLAAELSGANAGPAIFQVGPNVLYRSKHIPRALYAGPGSKAEGLDLLKAAVDKLPRDRDLVIYCGCCPWDKCPNIKPALELLQKMGFAHVRAMHVPTNFKADWVDHGYPVESAVE